MLDTTKPPITDPRLPTPDDRPEADVVLYDGECLLCAGGARLLAGLDFQGRLAFLSLHDPRVRTRWPELSFSRLVRELHVIDPAGRQHRGAEAIRWLARRVPALWPALPILHLPGTLPLWRRLYRELAGRRGAGTCDERCRV